MRIKELIENIDSTSKDYEKKIRDAFEMAYKSQIAVEEILISRMTSSETLPDDEWQQILKKLDTVIFYFEKAIALFAKYQIKKNTFDETNYNDVIKDIMLMRDAIRKARSILPNRLDEDITDFKAADGQLSAMGSKRKKT